MDKQDTDVNMDDKGLRPVTSSVADPSKADVPALGRRFSDVAASVPIKKRRLLNMEVARSPSPPRRVVLKQVEPKPTGDNKPQGVQAIEDSEMTDAGVSEGDGRHVAPASKEQRDCIESCAGTGSTEKVSCAGEVHQALKDFAPLENAVATVELKKAGLQAGSKVDLDLGSVGSQVEEQLNVVVVSDIVNDKKHEQGMTEGVEHLQPKLASEDVRQEGTEQSHLNRIPSLLKTEVDLGPVDTKEALEGGEEGSNMVKRVVEEGTSGGDSVRPSSRHVDAGNSQSCKKEVAIRDIDRNSSRDVRLHWDLNMDMEEWERPTEDGGVVASSSRQFSEVQYRASTNGQSQVSLNLKVDTSSSHTAQKQTGNEAPVLFERDSGAETQRVDTGEFVEYDEPEFDDEEEPVVESDKLLTGSVSERTAEKSQGAVEGAKVAEAWDISVEEFEAEHVDYDDSDNNDAGPELDERTSTAQQAESKLRADELLVGTGEGSEVKSLRKLKSTPGENGVRASSDGSYHNNAFKDLKPVLPRFNSSPEHAGEERHEQGRSSVHTGTAGLGTGRICDDRVGHSVETGHHGDADDRKLRDAGSRRVDKWSQSSRDVVGAGAGYVQRPDRSEPAPRTKSTGWDQLPEGFENPADALRAVKDPGRVGRSSLWSGPPGRGSTSGGVASSRFTGGAGRPLATRMESAGERGRLDDDPWGRDDGTRGRRVEESLDMSPRRSSPREIGRGRSRGRGASPASGRGRGGRVDPWLDSPNGPGSWGPPGRHPSPPGRYEMSFGPGPRGPPNAAAMAAAKVESSGFVVAPDGTITKAESPGGSSMRGRVGRGVGPGMLNMGRGPSLGMGVGPGMGVGMRVGMGPGRGLGVGPGMGMNVGMGLGLGMGVGPGVGMGMPGRGGPGGRGRAMMDSFSGPPYSRGIPPFAGNSNRGEEFPDNGWVRRDRSLSPSRAHGRRSPVQSPPGGTRSKSRTRSRTPPRLRTPPRPSNSGGSGGPLVSRKRSRSPGIVTQRLDVRVPEPLSPARRSVPPPPKLPLPPPPRNQRSPPAGLKRLSDTKREGDRSRERERVLGRVRSPPRRTSPHVVHGSSLMDERDRALLAGIRHVSPPVVRHRLDGATGSVLGGQESGLSGPGSAVIAAEGRTHVENTVGVKKEEQVGLRLDRNREGIRAVHERDRDRRLDSGLRRDSGKDEDRLKGSHGGRPNPAGGSFKVSYASSREGDDDVAPRRRRPSP